MNSAEIPYPRPISMVRVAASRVTHSPSAAPSVVPMATGNRL